MVDRHPAFVSEPGVDPVPLAPEAAQVPVGRRRRAALRPSRVRPAARERLFSLVEINSAAPIARAAGSAKTSTATVVTKPRAAQASDAVELPRARPYRR